MIPTGWNPGRHPLPDGSTETEAQAATRLFKEYPNTKTVRKFFDGPLGSATDGALGVVPPGVRVAVSWVYSATMPNVIPFVDHLLYTRGVAGVDLCVSHEPEKKITPDQLLKANQALNDQTSGHPARGSGVLRLAACMTVQRARIWAPADLDRFATQSLAEVIDVLAWDWYPSSDKVSAITHYEAPEEAFELIAGHSAHLGLPWAIWEFNHARIIKANGFPVDLDMDGEMCAAWMGDMHAYATDNGCVSWHQFHKGGGDLTYPGLERMPEYEALNEMMTGFQPDPSHPQYRAGYEMGVSAGTKRAYDTVIEFAQVQRG